MILMLLIASIQRLPAQVWQWSVDDKVQTRTKVAIAEKVVSQKDILKFQLKASGGCAVYISLDR